MKTSSEFRTNCYFTPLLSRAARNSSLARQDFALDIGVLEIVPLLFGRDDAMANEDGFAFKAAAVLPLVVAGPFIQAKRNAAVSLRGGNLRPPAN